MADLGKRFVAKVDRSGDHHVWRGARTSDGGGQLKVDGKVTTARRVAWELAHGPLAAGERVLACPGDPACVRVEHLEVAAGAAPRRRRAAWGSGTVSRVRPGGYKLTVHTGRFEDGTIRRVHRTVEATSEAVARKLLPEFIAEVNAAPQPRSRMERDLTVYRSMRSGSRRGSASIASET